MKKRVVALITCLVMMLTSVWGGYIPEVKAAENSGTIVLNDFSNWRFVLSSSEGYVNISCTGVPGDYAKGPNFAEGEFVRNYITFAGGMTYEDFMEGAHYFYLANDHTIQFNWKNRTVPFEPGWSFILSADAQIPYNTDDNTTRYVGLDKQYVFTFRSGDENCANRVDMTGYKTTTFSMSTNVWGNGLVGNGSSIIVTSGIANYDTKYTDIYADESYRGYISLNGADMLDYASANGVEMRTVLDGSLVAIQIENWGKLRDDMVVGSSYLMFREGMPFVYTDTSGVKWRATLDATYIYNCTSSNSENTHVFKCTKYVAADAATYGLTTSTDGSWTHAQSDTNPEQYINPGFDVDSAGAMSGGQVNVLSTPIAKDYVEFSCFSYEEALDKGVAIRYIPTANCLQLGFDEAAVEAMKVGDTIVLKEGMPAIYDDGAAAKLDATYEFKVVEKADGRLRITKLLRGDDFALSKKVGMQIEEGSYIYHDVYIDAATIPSDANFMEKFEKEGKEDVAKNYFGISGISYEDYAPSVVLKRFYVIPGLRVNTLTDEYADLYQAGTKIVFKKGLPIIYDVTEGGTKKYKVIHLNKDYVFVHDGNSFLYDDTYDVDEFSDTKTLLDFEDVETKDLHALLGVTETEFSAPNLSLTTENTDINQGVKVQWSYDGSKDIYQHVYRDGAWSELFLAQAPNYQYLRFWVANPGHNHIDIRVALERAAAINYMDMSAAKLIMKDGQQTPAEILEDAIRIPKQFAGWVAIPIDAVKLADVTYASIEVSRVREAAEIEDYYILDEIVVSNQVMGNVKSTEGAADYGAFDTTVKGSGTIKNIIFMIGDGMGDGSLAAARLVREELFMDQIGRFGYIGTNNVSDQLTDSAAAGTALATGHKTTNGTVGLLKDWTPVMNLSEWMMCLGKKIGIVSSSYIVDATPATFAAHTTERGNYASIAKDMVDLDLDLILGGGQVQFNSAIKLEDGSYVGGIQYAKTVGGYQYVTNKEELAQVDGDKILGLFASDSMNYASARPETEPILADLTTAALSFLDNDEEGFFVMIEGGNIDHANHANIGESTITETIEFDDAIKVAMDYVDTHEDTLLVITADHETGGVHIVGDEVKFTTTGHTDEHVPYYVYGAGEEYFADLTDNTQIPKAIMAATLAGKDSSVLTMLGADALAESNIANVVKEDNSVVFTSNKDIESIEMENENVKYAIVKYRNAVEGLCGKIDDSIISYNYDGEWHYSDVITLRDDEMHNFTPVARVKDGSLLSIDVEGLSVEIAYVALYDSYEAAAASRTNAIFKGEEPHKPEEPQQHKCAENATKVAGKQPDCDNVGNIEHWVCSCGAKYKDEACTQPVEDVMLRAKGHNSNKIIPGTLAGIGKTGKTEGRACSVCGKVMVAQKSIPAIQKPGVSKITKATGAKKKITIKFKKVSEIQGYEIQIATKKNMKKGLKKFTIKASAKKYVAKKLKAKTNYWVRIRTYKTVNGDKVYSNWTAKKKVKTK